MTTRRAAPKTANAHQVGGDHYTQMPIEPWDIIDT
jgi:hypothetical protein